MIKIMILGAGQLTDKHMKNVPKVNVDKFDSRYAQMRRSTLARVIKEAFKSSPLADEISFVEISSMTEIIGGQHAPSILIYYSRHIHDRRVVAAMEILRKHLTVEIIAIKADLHWPSEENQEKH